MIDVVLKALTPVIQQVFPDKEKQAEARLKLLEMHQNGDLKRIAAQAEIVTSEAQGDSWLQRNWRPLTMLTFVSLIVAKWLGFTAPGITDALELKLLDIIQIGLGGYVLGRSGEKMIDRWCAKYSNSN